MTTYNKFDPAHYVAGSPTIALTAGEIEKYGQMMFNRLNAHPFAGSKHPDHVGWFELRKSQITTTLEQLGSLETISADSDYYIERYYNLKHYDDVALCISGFYPTQHPVEEVARDLLEFVEDVAVIAKLTGHLQKV